MIYSMNTGLLMLENRSQTSIEVKILSLLCSKIDENARSFKSVKFNISANLEESEGGINKVSLKFLFVIFTEPRVVKYQVEGKADIQGEMEEIKKVLSQHPTTKVPMVLYDIYQHLYAQVFVLSKMIDAPCPSPELLSTSQAVASKDNGVQQEVPSEVSAESSPKVEKASAEQEPDMPVTSN